MCPVLGLGQHGKGCLRGGCWCAGEFPHALGRFGEQSSPPAPGAGMPARSDPARLCRSWPRDPRATPFTGTPCHPDPHLPGLTHHRGCSSTPAPSLSTQGTLSLLLPLGPALLQKRPPSCLHRERGPSLARPARGLCTGTWQPGALSAPSARLALLRRQRGVPGPSRGTAVPLLGQPAQGLSLREVRAAPLCNLLPHGPAPVVFSGSHPGAGVWGAWQHLGEVVWPCGAMLGPLSASQ